MRVRSPDPRLAPLLALRRLLPLVEDDEAKREAKLARRIDLKDRLK